MKSADDQSIPTALTFIIILRSRDWVGDYVHKCILYISQVITLCVCEQVQHTCIFGEYKWVNELLDWRGTYTWRNLTGKSGTT